MIAVLVPRWQLFRIQGIRWQRLRIPIAKKTCVQKLAVPKIFFALQQFQSIQSEAKKKIALAPDFLSGPLLALNQATAHCLQCSTAHRLAYGETLSWAAPFLRYSFNLS